MSDEVRYKVLLEGTDDWVPIGYLLRLVAVDAAGPDEARERAVSVVRSLLHEGLVEVGEVPADGPFAAWSGTTEEIAARVERELRADMEGCSEQAGWCCWLSNTPAGDEMAEQHG